MSTKWPEPVTLLADLVRTESLSGDEARVASVLATWAAEAGLDPGVDDASVRVELTGAEPGPTLLLGSHLDTVPPGEGWTRDPFGASIEKGLLHGRGSVDAKGSVASMFSAAADLARDGALRRGRLVVLATYREETLHTSMPVALERVGRPDAALVGEPTRLRPCVAQRGLIVLRLVWRGTSRHAGWAAENPSERDNAVEKAAAELADLAQLSFDRSHPLLGRVSLTPTRIEGGTANNVIPDLCTAVLDIRTTPSYEVEEIIEIVRSRVSAHVEVASTRCLPCETPSGSRLLRAIRTVLPDADPFGSPTASDWISLRDVDAVKFGPGDSRLSHTNRECVPVDEILEAARFYAAIARAYL